MQRSTSQVFERHPRVSVTDPTKFIIERLLDGSITQQEELDNDLCALYVDKQLNPFVQEHVIPLLTPAALHALNKKMIVCEFSRHGKEAFRNKTLAKFSLHAEMNNYLSEEGREILEGLRTLDSDIAEAGIIIANKKLLHEPLQDDINKQNNLIEQLANEIYYNFNQCLSSAVLDHIGLIHQTLFPQGTRVNKETLVSFVMFNVFGVKMPTNFDSPLCEFLYDKFTQKRELSYADENEENNRRRQEMLNFYAEYRAKKSKHPGISDEDIHDIKRIFDKSRRFHLLRKEADSKECAILFAGESDSERYDNLQKYMQSEEDAIAKGAGKKRLYQAIVNFYKGKNIDYQQFFAIQKRTYAASGSTLRRSMGYHM